MTSPADEHTAWPGWPGPRRAGRGFDPAARAAVASYLADRRPPPVDRPDAWLRTHRGVRSGRNRPSDAARETVHRVAKVVPADPVKDLAGIYVTGCGLYLRVHESIRTGATMTCARTGCPTVPRTHERPVTVVRPPGPCHGVAANKKPRRDATGNSVAIRADEDSLRSVKGPAVNRVNGQPRSQAQQPRATGNHPTRTTSPGRAAGPSEGEPRVLESAATQALHPTARAGVPHERPSLPPAEGDGPDGSRSPDMSATRASAPAASGEHAGREIGPGRGEPPTHPALAASVMRAAVSSATGLPTVDLASTPARTRTPASLCRGGVLPTNAPIDLRKREALT